MTIKDARAALDAVRTELHAQESDGQEYWSGFEPGSLAPAVGQACLLPAFDELTVGYKDRSALLGGTAFAPGLALGPSIIVDGRMVGTWKRTRRRDSVLVDFQLFAALTRRQRAALEDAAKQYGTFVGLPVTMQP